MYYRQVLLFGVFNSNKLFICTSELIKLLLMVLIGFANMHKHVHVENQASPPHIFHLEQLSAGSGVPEYRDMYSLFNAEGSLMRVCMYLCVCSKSSLKQLAQLKRNFIVKPQWNRGEKFILMILVICYSSFEYCQPLGAGAFRRAFTTNVAPQCRAISRALEIEKLKAPLFRGPRGPGIQMTGALNVYA